MLNPSINEIRKKADSRYTLCILSARRARDLIDGKPKLTEEDTERPVSIAAYEIAEDLITYRHRSDEEPAAEVSDADEIVEASAEEVIDDMEDAATAEVPETVVSEEPEAEAAPEAEAPAEEA